MPYKGDKDLRPNEIRCSDALLFESGRLGVGQDPKNLILRQQFAKAFMELDLKKKVIINVDETWLGMSDFRR